MRAATSVAILALLAVGPARATTATIVDCGTFKARWSAAVRAAVPDQPDLAYKPGVGPDEPEGVSSARDVVARLRCAGGQLVRVELAESAGATPRQHIKPFLGYAAATLVALDGDLGATEAATMIEMLRAEAGPERDGVTSFGPYEIAYTIAREGGGSGLVVDLPEN